MKRPARRFVVSGVSPLGLRWYSRRLTKAGAERLILKEIRALWWMLEIGMIRGQIWERRREALEIIGARDADYYRRAQG